MLETDTFIYQCTIRYSVLVLMYLELQDIFSLMFQLIKTKKSHLNIVILSLMAFHGLPNLNLIPRPLIDQAEGKIWSNPTLYPWLPVRSVTGNESAHAQSKSSIFDVLINKSDRAMKFFLTKCGYTYISQVSMNQLILCCFCYFLTSSPTWQLVWTQLTQCTKTSKQHTATSMRKFF